MTHVENDTGGKGRLGLWIKRVIFLILPVLVLVGAVVGSIGMSAFSPEPEENEDVVEALPVLIAPAVTETVFLSVVSQGEVRPRTSVVLASEVGGRVALVSDTLLPGGAFRRGDLLVRVDPAEFSLRVTQAQANVAQAETALVQAQSEARTAQQDIADLGIDDVSDLALRRPQVAEAEARLASAEAALDEARLNLSRADVRAPFTGRVRSRTVNTGAYITPGAPLGEIFASDIVEIPVALTDRDLASLGLGIGFVATREVPGPTVTLTALVADRQHTWTGRVTRTDSSIDTETRVLFAYVEVEDPYGAASDNGVPLAVGLFVTAEIQGLTLPDSVVVPRTALRGDDRVFVAGEDDTLEIRPVTVVSSNRQRAVLSSGLLPGEKVITSPVRDAGNGMKINPVEPESLLADGAATEGDTSVIAE
ncbi:MAG: efflux RND transporter periplasmic adaptor subunit [Pseudomonadota bacterium]